MLQANLNAFRTAKNRGKTKHTLRMTLLLLRMAAPVTSGPETQMCLCISNELLAGAILLFRTRSN